MTARTRRTAVNFMAAVPVADGRLKNRTKVNNKIPQNQQIFVEYLFYKRLVFTGFRALFAV